jgi:hypothetical protein
MNAKPTDTCTPSPHGWTLDTLEEYLTSKLQAVEALSNERETVNKERFATSEKAVTTAMAAQEKAIGAAMTASEKAILKAEAAAEKRSEASNEIRAAMIDQQKNFADKAQTEYRFGALDQRLEESSKLIGKRLDGIDLAFSAAGGKSQGVVMSASIAVQIILVAASVAGIVAVITTFAHHSGG